MSRLIREVLIPLGGIGIGLNEAFVHEGDPRFYLLVFAAAMMGLSAFIKPEDVASVVDRMRRPANGAGSAREPDDKPRPALAVAVGRLALAALAWRYA